MKKVVFVLCILCFISCTEEKKEDSHFLVGNWERLNDRPNHKTYEIWKSDLTGIGYTLKGKDTVFKEILSIIKKNDTTYLQVEGVNENPTLFKFISQTDTSFVSHNPKNKFPQMIKYFKDSDTLKAVISSDGYSSGFKFVKSK